MILIRAREESCVHRARRVQAAAAAAGVSCLAFWLPSRSNAGVLPRGIVACAGLGVGNRSDDALLQQMVHERDHLHAQLVLPQVVSLFENHRALARRARAVARRHAEAQPAPSDSTPRHIFLPPTKTLRGLLGINRRRAAAQTSPRDTQHTPEREREREPEPGPIPRT